MLTPYGRATVRSVLGLCIEGGLRFKVICHCLASPLMLYEAWKDIYTTDGETAICHLVNNKEIEKNTSSRRGHENLTPERNKSKEAIATN